MANDPHTFTIRLAGRSGIARSQLLALLAQYLKDHNYRVLNTPDSQENESTIYVEAPQLGASK